jgi:flagellar basal body rod protein FlgG
MNVSSIALTGVQAAQTRLAASAQNIANSNTPGYRAQSVVQTALEPLGGTVAQTVRSADPTAGATSAAPAPGLQASDVIEQLSARNAALANLQVFRRANEAVGSLLDQRA